MVEKNSKVANLVVAGIDGQIRQLKDLIAELEKEKETYLTKPAIKPQSHNHKLHKGKAKRITSKHLTTGKSQRVRVIEAIQRMPGKFESKEVFNDVNNDKQGPPLVKESFYSIFSRLKDEVYEKAGEIDGKNTYQKIAQK